MILQRTTCAKQEIRTGNENLHYNDNILQLQKTSVCVNKKGLQILYTM